MATLISSIKNESTGTLELRLPGYNPVKIVTIAAGATVDLLAQLSMDTLEALQRQLVVMIAAGSISSQATTGSGVIIGHNDNATSLRVKGPQAPSEGGLDVQDYNGIFYNDGYAVSGTLKTRVIHGANLEMDLEIQSPHQLRLTANDGSQTDPEIWMSSQNGIKINTRNDSEGISPKQLLIDRVDTVTVGAGNTSDVNLDVSAGNLRLLAGNTTGAVVLPLLTDAERGALTPVKGMLIMNADTSLLNVYDGSAWKAVDVSAV